MKQAEPVVVIGAGIAGLAAALALAARGFNVRVFERTERLDEVGAGIQLSPNALRILDRLGLLPVLRERGVEAAHVALRALGDGRVLARVPARGSDGTPYLAIRRADLQSALVEAVAATPRIRLDLGTSLTSLDHRPSWDDDPDADEGQPVFAFTRSDGPEETVAAQVAIAADGVRSTAARLLGHPPAADSGDVAWRLTLAAKDPAPPGIEAWLGAACHAVAYPVDGGRSINLVLVLPEGAAGPCEAMRTADTRLGDMVAGAAGAATRWPLATADRRRRAGDPSGLLLIGDAAHAMLPYAAQGAALAIEDGFVAAACLEAAPSPAAAWARFEAERRPRWERVRRRVAFHRRIYHLPAPFSSVRNLAMKLRGEASLGADLAWLYDWHPPPP